ncbi:hypothetical protein crov088 [Cafeteria roenbergensis virus]|uniref:Uncharacterized protein n=1 Tax=Cafeteria roenbergensis virus (strain BV-PW1) TaxID=693272 RepID=E3T4K8_CROVB|nr:hypothetical protein crov088 [Cafeteria roenbergensis virus BV-PW1]ADO67121.1 hypothetical protein crov088 [Cafeteria roenbergensis virus BV-PW1]
MGNNIVKPGSNNISTDFLPDKDTPFGAFMRQTIQNTMEKDKRAEYYNQEYNVHLKRACCLGALNENDTSIPKYIEYPLPFFNDAANSRCPLNFEIDNTDPKIILYKKNNKVSYTMKYLSDDKKQYKFYQGEIKNNNIPLFKKELNTDGTAYEYKYKKPAADHENKMTLRYIEKLQKDEDGYIYYNENGFPIASKSTINHLENKDTHFDLSECLVRKSIKLDLYAPPNENVENYCNNTRTITLDNNKSSYADVGETTDASTIAQNSDCPNFMSYYCGKALKEQGCITTTTFNRNGFNVVKGTYNYGNKFCVSAPSGDTPGKYTTQLRDCDCINSGVGPNLNNNYDPRKFVEGTWPNSFDDGTGKVDPTKDPYGLLTDNDLSLSAEEIQQKFLIKPDMLEANYISDYAININEQPKDSQIPWQTDSFCSASLGNAGGTDYKSNPFIPKSARQTLSTTVCNAEMNFNNLEVGNNANVYGNKLINLCGANVNDDFAEKLEAIFSKPTGNASKQESQDKINEIQSNFVTYETNISSLNNRLPELKKNVSNKTLVEATTNLINLRTDKNTINNYKTSIPAEKTIYMDLKNKNSDLTYAKTSADFDQLISGLNNLPEIDPIIKLYEDHVNSLNVTSSTSPSTTPSTTSTDSTTPSTNPATPSTNPVTPSTNSSTDTSSTIDSALNFGPNNIYLYIGGGIIILIVIIIIIILLLSGGGSKYDRYDDEY